MIAIVDYEAGNLTSVWRAFNALNIPAKITRAHQEILAAGRVVFPGVGHARAAMQSLRKYGLDQVLREVYQKGNPLLGICLGSQIVLDHSQEGDTECLKLVPGETRRFPLRHIDGRGTRLKVPHMGWNSLQLKNSHPIMRGMDERSQFYFVHSYYPAPANPEHIVAESDYGFNFTAMLARNNLVATQFHPEKSGQPGLRLLANFANWKL